MRTLRGVSWCVLVLSGLAAGARAELLSSDGWTIAGTDGSPAKGPADEPPSPAEVRGSAIAGLSLRIDLKTRHAIHRIVVLAGETGANQATPGKTGDTDLAGSPGFPKKVQVFVGDAPETQDLAAEYEVPQRGGARQPGDMDLRFQPTAGRYVRLVAAKADADGCSWSIGCLQLYGFPNPAALEKKDAVVADAKAPAPLRLAAEELRYYLGELTGRAHPIVTPDEAAAYPGTLYRIADLAPLAATYEALVENQKAGKFPATPVNVERQGREVVFRAWPYRNVLWSVWEFLDRQGVRWVLPEPLGDYVPAGGGVRLDILPLRYKPSTECIYANFDTQRFRAKGTAAPTAGFLYFWRNRWSHSWGNCQSSVLGGAEVPKAKPAAAAVKEEYKEGFVGYPHNFSSVVPDRILKAHPGWLGLARDERFGKENAGKRCFGPVPCLTNDELIQFVADKASAWAALTPGVPQRFDLLPMDGALYCECERCLALNQPFVKPDVPYSAYPTYWGSDCYYRFVCEVAKRVQKEAPQVSFGALAYANVLVPPRQIEKFPDNVVVQVCQYGATNLPVSAAPNAKMKEYLDAWAAKCRRLENYDYVLLNENKATWPMPVPLVAGIVDRAKYLHTIGALDGGTQGAPECLPYCPWNFYAYPRIMWNVERTADEILKDFCDACFRESAKPMYEYCKAAQDYHVAKSLSLHEERGYGYDLAPGRFPYHLLKTMSSHLDAAELSARHWVTKRRLETMRQGFAWLLQARALTPQNLASDEGFPVLGPGRQPLVITPQNAVIGLRTVKDRKAIMLYGGLRLGHHVRFEQAGKYVVTIKARAWEREKRGAKQRNMVVNVDAQSFGPVDVPDGAGEYTINVTAPAGVWELTVQVIENAGPVQVEQATVRPER